MDDFYERLIVRAATFDELLGDDFEALPGQKDHADAAARRLAAWCRSSASGDWLLFGRRMERDGLAAAAVLARFATVRRRATAAPPAWVDDAIWIEAALRSPGKAPVRAPARAFEHLFAPLAEQAEALLWGFADARAADNLTEAARADLRHLLLDALSELCAPALYERFAKARSATGAQADPPAAGATARYDRFVAEMQAGGLRRLFEDKAVLLRLIAVLTRQWLETAREFVLRLDADLAAVRRDILRCEAAGRVATVAGGLSDPHHGGRSVLIVGFENGQRAVYKPKDLRLDAAWHALVERLNRAGAPLELKAARALAREGHGWTEFIAHTGCADAQGCRQFFRRAGAWLALFHAFAGLDMHQENMIAAGDHPVPIDLEMILQAAAEEHKTGEEDSQAFEAATDIVANSVMMVGLFPVYGRAPDNTIFAFGGVASDWASGTRLVWNDVNSDRMRPAKAKVASSTVPNLPHVQGRYATLGDHVDDFVAGFSDYARFLLARTRDADQGGLFDGFDGLAVRKLVRPTRFYYLLLQRLKDHRTMEDGVAWSVQADFLARLANWEKDCDPLWPLQRAERAALVALNVPHFVAPSDGGEIHDGDGGAVRAQTTPGLDRARARVRDLDAAEIAWQVEVIRQNTSTLAPSAFAPGAPAEPKPLAQADAARPASPGAFRAEADAIADEIARHAVRRGAGAAWIGLDWLGDSEVSQLTVLGPDLYNGAGGIALFLAAHARATGRGASADLARAALAHLRKTLRGRHAARMARALGIGGAGGVGSIVYALAVTARCLDDAGLLADAHAAAALISDDLIAADAQLDVVGGSAGAALALLRLYRDAGSADVLARATRCGEHLVAQPRVGPPGRGSFHGQGSGERVLNGMSHGAAGFAYALAALAAATGRQDFADAAAECIAFENASYDPARSNWPDFREAQPEWPCQWCHGAAGIGLARIGMSKRAGRGGRTDRAAEPVSDDIRNALAGTQRGWPNAVDTLCCGTLGSVEFLCEAADTLGRNDLRTLAARRLTAVLESAAATGDYRWNRGERRFNLGLFRGLAGVGYACLRQAEDGLPNVLIWE